MFCGQVCQVSVIFSQTMKNERYYLYKRTGRLADPIGKIIFHVV